MGDVGRKKAMAMALSIAIVLSVLCSTTNSVSFQECYAGCFIVCAIQPTRTLSSCGFECLMDCIIPTQTQNQSKSKVGFTAATSPFQLCRLGCACVRCTNISTFNHPAAKEVAGCVASCSAFCTNSN